MLIYRMMLPLCIPQFFRLIGRLECSRGRDFFDELPNGSGPEYPAGKRKNAISPSKTAAMAFGHEKRSAKLPFFFNSFSEALQKSTQFGTILHGSRKYRGIQSALPELYNTVEVKNYAE